MEKEKCITNSITPNKVAVRELGEGHIVLSFVNRIGDEDNITEINLSIEGYKVVLEAMLKTSFDYEEKYNRNIIDEIVSEAEECVEK